MQSQLARTGIKSVGLSDLFVFNAGGVWGTPFLQLLGGGVLPRSWIFGRQGKILATNFLGRVYSSGFALGCRSLLFGLPFEQLGLVSFQCSVSWVLSRLLGQSVGLCLL